MPFAMLNAIIADIALIAVVIAVLAFASGFAVHALFF